MTSLLCCETVINMFKQFFCCCLDLVGFGFLVFYGTQFYKNYIVRSILEE